jgi:hypothetical protein
MVVRSAGTLTRMHALQRTGVKQVLWELALKLRFHCRSVASETDLGGEPYTVLAFCLTKQVAPGVLCLMCARPVLGSEADAALHGGILRFVERFLEPPPSLDVATDERWVSHLRREGLQRCISARCWCD